MELLDVVDENNQITGIKADRNEIHEKGLWHREISVFIMNHAKQILLQKRAAKKVAPNMWSLTAGHVESGEDAKQAAMRETEEELGIRNLKLEDFELIDIKKAMRSRGKHINNKFDYLFLLKTDKKINEFVLQETEVADVKIGRAHV